MTARHRQTAGIRRAPTETNMSELDMCASARQSIWHDIPYYARIDATQQALEESKGESPEI